MQVPSLPGYLVEAYQNHAKTAASDRTEPEIRAGDAVETHRCYLARREANGFKRPGKVDGAGDRKPKRPRIGHPHKQAVDAVRRAGCSRWD